MMTKRTPKPKKLATPITGVNEAPVDGVRPEAIVATAESAELTVNGIPISALPVEVQHLIGYAMTDQGIAERNAKRVDSMGRPHSGIQVIVNEGFDQQIRARADAQEPWETANPLLDAKLAFQKPGFRYRGLSPTVIAKKGMRGWQAVLDGRGEPVRVGKLVLAEMPIERAERRNKKFRDEGNTNAADAKGRFISDHEKAVRDSGSEGVRILRAGELLHDSADPTRPISIGVRSSRGNEGLDAAA